MLTRKLLGMLLAMVVVLLPLAAPGQQDNSAKKGVPELREEAGRAYYAKDYVAFRNALIQLNRLRPNNGEYMYQLVLAHALLDEKTAAFNTMLKMQQQGLSYDFDQTEDSLNLRDTEIYGYLNNLMKTAGEPFGIVTEFARLGPEIRFPEGLTWDPTRNAFLVGTVTDGLVLAVDQEGNSQELLRSGAENGMWAIFDLLVDPLRNRLWISSSASPQYSGFDPVDTGRSAIFEFTLDELELVRRYPVPVDGLPHNLGNMAMAPSGDLFAADSRLPIIYWLKAGEDRMKGIFASRALVSLRGLALSGDGTMLYVADYELGIVRIDVASGEFGFLDIPANLNLGGIDGLYWWNDHLLVIQNGISPERVMRLKLNSAGTGVENVAPLAVAQEIFDLPNYGTVVENQLYFFANSHWDSAGDQLKPVRIVQTNIEQALALVNPEKQEFLRQKAESERSRPPSGQPEDEATPGSGG